LNLEKGLELRISDNSQKMIKDLHLAHFHSLAQLRDRVYECVKVLEVEMRKAKKQLSELEEEES